MACGDTNLSESKVKTLVEQCLVLMNENMLKPAFIGTNNLSSEELEALIKANTDRLVLQQIKEPLLENETTAIVSALVLQENMNDGEVTSTDDVVVRFLFRKNMDDEWVFDGAKKSVFNVRECDSLSY
jgi:hypothetical protein